MQQVYNEGQRMEVEGHEVTIGPSYESPIGLVQLASATNKGAVINWEQKQRIKNILYGVETFAVEVYPPESQMVDVVNAYHLWVLIGKQGEAPIGWNNGRNVLHDSRKARTIKSRPPQNSLKHY
jgi:hypothetical protein